jgi:hypothetical protein
MVNFVRIYRNNEFILLTLEDYLSDYHSEMPEGWAEVSHWIDRVFKIKNEEEYKKVSEEMQVETLDLNKIKTTYDNLEKEDNRFDRDILKFISFLFGTSYFTKIGNPSIDQWLNAIDINHPFSERENGGFSFVDALEYKQGQNAIRKSLLTTLHWISSQGGA